MILCKSYYKTLLQPFTFFVFHFHHIDVRCRRDDVIEDNEVIIDYRLFQRISGRVDKG